MPFLALQGVFNVGITGSLWTTPFGFYNERDQPALASRHPDASRQPASVIVEKREFYNFSTMGFVGLYRDPRMRPGILWQIRFGEAPEWLAPSLIMLALATLGAAGLRTRHRWLLFAIGPLFVVAYQWYPIYHPHYVIFALPALLLLIALVPQVAQQLSERWGKMAVSCGRRIPRRNIRGVVGAARRLESTRRDASRARVGRRGVEGGDCTRCRAVLGASAPRGTAHGVRLQRQRAMARRRANHSRAQPGATQSRVVRLLREAATESRYLAVRSYKRPTLPTRHGA
jgi:hypothetical protein